MCSSLWTIREQYRFIALLLQEEEGSAVTAKMATRRRGRKPAKFDSKLKLERSQQSARECRARKKLRYQYLEELVASREKAIIVLRKELDAVYFHTHSARSSSHSVIGYGGGYGYSCGGVTSHQIGHNI